MVRYRGNTRGLGQLCVHLHGLALPAAAASTAAAAAGGAGGSAGDSAGANPRPPAAVASPTAATPTAAATAAVALSTAAVTPTATPTTAATAAVAVMVLRHRGRRLPLHGAPRHSASPDSVGPGRAPGDVAGLLHHPGGSLSRACSPPAHCGRRPRRDRLLVRGRALLRRRPRVQRRPRLLVLRRRPLEQRRARRRPLAGAIRPTRAHVDRGFVPHGWRGVGTRLGGRLHLLPLACRLPVRHDQDVCGQAGRGPLPDVSGASARLLREHAVPPLPLFVGRSHRSAGPSRRRRDDCAVRSAGAPVGRCRQAPLQHSHAYTSTAARCRR
mmetsp:Transcript_4418/g.14280  ORF Transcript_4418/g.14280 Transcript_4418/m.14280 type:complete len:327 (+) Transcript_4418:1072-2052(+)